MCTWRHLSCWFKCSWCPLIVWDTRRMKKMKGLSLQKGPASPCGTYVINQVSTRLINHDVPYLISQIDFYFISVFNCTKFCWQLWPEDHFLHKDSICQTRVRRFSYENIYYGKKTLAPVDVKAEDSELPSSFSGDLADVSVSAYFCFLCHGLLEATTTRKVHLLS